MQGIDGHVKRFAPSPAGGRGRPGRDVAGLGVDGAVGRPRPSAATRERVLEAAAELGYRPDRTASLLARRRTHLVGVQMVAGSAFHAELVEDLYEAAERQGYDVVLSAVTRTRDERRATETLVDFRCEALVLLGPVAPASQLAALGRQLPVVVIGRRVAGDAVDVVRSADAEGVGQAVEHLVGLGHRSIAYVDGGRGTIAADRRRGYRTAMRRHGLTDHIRVLPGDHTEAAGARAARALLDAGDGLPTAVVAYNDHCALGLLDAFNRAGVAVPGGSRWRLRRQQPVPAGPRQPDHGQPGRPPPGRARRGRGRGAPRGRPPRRAPRDRARPAPGRPGHHRPAAGAGAVSEQDRFTPEEWRTLQFAPFWMFSAVVGAYDRFDPRDFQVFGAAWRWPP